MPSAIQVSSLCKTGVMPTNMDNIDNYMIFANYSGNMAKSYLDDEYKLDYFMEDVGLNAYYYYIRQVMPFWLNVENFEIPAYFRGYFYYFKHKQLLARYYLERFSNDLGNMEDFDWNKPFYPGYYSTLMYNNGMVMPQRSRHTNVPFYKYRYLKVSSSVPYFCAIYFILFIIYFISSLVYKFVASRMSRL